MPNHCFQSTSGVLRQQTVGSVCMLLGSFVSCNVVCTSSTSASTSSMSSSTISSFVIIARWRRKVKRSRCDAVHAHHQDHRHLHHSRCERSYRVTLPTPFLAIRVIFLILSVLQPAKHDVKFVDMLQKSRLTNCSPFLSLYSILCLVVTSGG